VFPKQDDVCFQNKMMWWPMQAAFGLRGGHFQAETTPVSVVGSTIANKPQTSSFGALNEPG
jgi:hypothetical protein